MKEGTRTFLSSVFLLLLVFSIGIIPSFGVEEVNAAGEGYWTTLAPLPTPSDINTIGAAVVDGKIYFIGWRAYQKYDTKTNNWTSITPPPIYNGGADAVAFQNKIYLIGGSETAPTQVYDPKTDTWENKTSIPTPRSAQANVVDNKIYVISGHMPSGYYLTNPSSANGVYDPAMDSWSNMTPIPIPVEGYASAVLDNKIYIIGGATKSGGIEYNSTKYVQIFDPQTNQWTNGTPIPTGVVAAGACATTGVSAPKRIYVVGGSTGYRLNNPAALAINLTQVYDPETGNWSVAAPMPTTRHGLTLVNIDDELYANGGNYYGDILANEKYTPTDYIPEFPSWTLMFMILIVLAVAVVIYKRRLRPQTN